MRAEDFAKHLDSAVEHGPQGNALTAFRDGLGMLHETAVAALGESPAQLASVESDLQHLGTVFASALNEQAAQK